LAQYQSVNVAIVAYRGRGGISWRSVSACLSPDQPDQKNAKCDGHDRSHLDAGIGETRDLRNDTPRQVRCERPQQALEYESHPKPGHEIAHTGVTIVGFTNVPSLMPQDASRLYARNVVSLLEHLAPGGELNLDFSDEITSGACVAGRPREAVA